MKKKILLAILLLPALVSQAQISMDGQFKEHSVFVPFPSILTPGGGDRYTLHDDYDKLLLPQVKPNTKSITIDIVPLEYNLFEERWDVCDKPGHSVLTYNTSGQITDICAPRHNNYYYKNNGYETGWSDTIHYSIVYKNGKIEKVIYDEGNDFKDTIFYRYDGNGHISRSKHYCGVYNINWTSKGCELLPVPGDYGLDKILKASKSKYEISKKGKVVSAVSFSHVDNSEMKTTVKMKKDNNGVAVEITTSSDDYNSFYFSCDDCRREQKTCFENKYDENNNLIEQLVYEIVCGEKIYTRGCKFSYKYEFYK